MYFFHQSTCNCPFHLIHTLLGTPWELSPPSSATPPPPWLSLWREKKNPSSSASDTTSMKANHFSPALLRFSPKTKSVILVITSPLQYHSVSQCPPVYFFSSGAAAQCTSFTIIAVTFFPLAVSLEVITEIPQRPRMKFFKATLCEVAFNNIKQINPLQLLSAAANDMTPFSTNSPQRWLFWFLMFKPLWWN